MPQCSAPASQLTPLTGLAVRCLAMVSRASQGFAALLVLGWAGGAATATGAPGSSSSCPPDKPAR